MCINIKKVQNIKTYRSLFLFLLLLFCYLDEWVLHHCCASNLTHKSISSQLTIIMGDTLCYSIAIDADLVLRKSLFYVLDLVVGLSYHLLLSLAQNLLESFLFWWVCVSSQGRSYYIELRRDGKSGPWLVFLNMG